MNMSSCWCHWCNLSVKEWSDKSHIKGMLWTIDLLKKSLNDKDNNENMTSYEKKVVLKNYYLILFLLKIIYFHYFMQNLGLETKLFIYIYMYIYILIGLMKELNP